MNHVEFLCAAGLCIPLQMRGTVFAAALWYTKEGSIGQWESLVTL